MKVKSLLMIGAGIAIFAFSLILLVQPTYTQESTPALMSTPAPHMVIFEDVPGPDTPTLGELAGDAADDAAILARVVEYYDLNHERLADLWRQDNPTRLAAVFSMYITHISLPYGETAFPGSLTEFISQERAHCGTYTYAQIHIALALGLTIRVIEFAGEHAWLEVWIDDGWEIFDATTNTRLSGGVEDMLAGLPREYQHYYTPLLDVDHPEARLHFAEGYDMQRLRNRMPALGVTYFPPGEMIIGDAMTGS
jgi:transglutaminase-like putative cysteine protease